METILPSLLKKIGIKKGDEIFIHSDIARVPAKNLPRPKKRLSLSDRLDCMMRNIFSDIQEVIEEEGTLMVPTYSYSFCENKIFDLENSPSQIGLFTEYIRKKEGSFRSVEPIHSVCSLGGNSKSYVSEVSNCCFGKDSIFDRLYKNNAWLVFLGTTMQPCTMAHYVEQTTNVPYRFFKNFKGNIKIGDKTTYHTHSYFVRHLDQNSNSVLDKAQKDLEDNNLYIQPDKKYLVSGIKAKDFCNFLGEKLNKNPYYFIKEDLS
ncbi:AAC(3) family N-acetyltransferase [Bacteriovoracales bacterium]|nr:AAC(3) family N-acetyltransferase [Bacteriovoracales bacterium]